VSLSGTTRVVRLGFRAAIGILTLLLMASMQGCGMDESREGPPFEPGSIEDPQSLLITNSDIEGVGPSTPYGVVLRWWQALQFGAVEGVRRSYAVRISSRETSRQIYRFQPRFSQPIDPKVETQGNRATMDVIVRTAIPLPGIPSVVRVVDFPARFDLLRSAAGWRLLVSSYRNFTQARPFPRQPGG
jgi:hypothetical protein